MKETLVLLKKSALSLLIFSVVLTFIYPAAVWAIGQLFFHHKANGSLIFDQNKQPIASSLIGQNFSSPSYFHPRPSLAGKGGYDGANSATSNFGPTSKKLAKSLQEHVEAYRKINNLNENTEIPIDAITFSASGLDPHISLANALLQIPRVAKARGMQESELKEVLLKHVEERSFGVLGEERVNVVLLNLKLDNLK